MKLPERYELLHSLVESVGLGLDVKDVGTILLRVETLSVDEKGKPEEEWKCFGIIPNDEPEHEGDITFTLIVYPRAKRGWLTCHFRKKDRVNPETD